MAAIVWAVVYFTPLCSLNSVEVEGNSRVSKDQIVDAVNVEHGTPLAQINVLEAGERVAAVPWVKSVTVSRDWPSSLVVDVEEYSVVAFRNRDGATELYGVEGYPFAVDTPPEGTIEITGDAARNPEVAKDAVNVVSSLSDNARGLISSIEARGPNEFALHLKDERLVVWGAAEDNKNKALAFDTVVQREGREFNISNPRLVTSR
nr:FtsQ-type POTRA domain-containing protein [Corynebacterium aquatimens]